MDNSPKLGQLLPLIKNFFVRLLQKINATSALPLQSKGKVLLEKVRQTFRITHKHYGLAITIDLLVLALVVILGVKPITNLVSPWAEKLQTPLADTNLKNHKLFAFAPGWSSSKLAKVQLDNLSTLAFFDLPVNSDGTISTDNTGYQNFKSDASQELFSQAHQKGIKVVVTLSQVNGSEVKQILNDPAAQNNTISDAITEVKNAGIDGVALDFEVNNNSNDLKDKYSQFVKNFTDRLHSQVPNSKLMVVVPDSLSSGSIYNLSNLSQFSDQVLMMAYNTPTPETKNASLISPVFAADSNSFFQQLSLAMGGETVNLPGSRVEMETAWYGNGDNYPLYVPKTQPVSTPGVENSLHTPLSAEMIDSLVSEVPDKSKASARKNIPYIAKALEDEGILNENVLSYAMATIEHETAGTFEPIDEIKGRRSAKRLGYEGGTDYFGRGFIQLTHLRNYQRIGQRIGMGDQLVQNPELASKPEVAAKVLAAFFKDNNVANLASSGDFVDARDPVNPDYYAYAIAKMALKYLYSIA